MKIPSKGSRRRRPLVPPVKTKLSRFAASEGRHHLSDRARILAERVKELNCLYTISRIFEKRILDLDSIIRETVQVIPTAWQYPDITGARILLNGKEFRTEKFTTTIWTQQCPIITYGVPVGTLAVSYSEQRPEQDEGPFLKEERNLLNVIAQRLGEITERKSAEQKLARYREKLRSLTTELALSEERERRKIAQAIHDKIGQVLTIVNIKIDTLLESASTDELARTLSDIRKLVSEVIKDSRSLTFDLSPPILYELGFKAALEWLVEHIEKQFGFVVELNCPEKEIRLSIEWRVMLFLAVRELLINVAKHAKARTVQISVKKKGGEIIVTVADDGIGMDVTRIEQGAASREGFGLFSIHERMEHMGSRIEISSKPGHGTCVTLFVPFAAK